MILKNIHNVFLFVENIKESALWYANVLDTKLDIIFDNFALLKIDENKLCFHLADKKSPQSLGGSVTYWYVDNLEEAANIFLKHGGIIYRGPIKIPEANEGICQIQDPFGNVIGLQGKYRSE